MRGVELSEKYKKVDLFELLQTKCGDYVEDEKKNKVWQTPFGFSIKDSLNQMDNDYTILFFEYDEDLSCVGKDKDERSGCFSKSDICQIFEHLESHQNALEKPGSIVILEKILDCEAKRKYGKFGSWHISKDGVSMFNNPFQISLGYADGANNFEIWFMDLEENPREYQSLGSTLLALHHFNKIK